MAVAMFAIHWQNGFFINFTCAAGRQHGIEYNLALIGGLLGTMVYGGGGASLDRAITKLEE
jgi:putative oxidoreductase